MSNNDETMDQVEMFFADCLIPSTTDRTAFTDVWKTYQTYCQAVNQTTEATMVGFSKRLVGRYFKKMIKGKPFYCLTIRENLFKYE